MRCRLPGDGDQSVFRRLVVLEGCQHSQLSREFGRLARLPWALPVQQWRDRHRAEYMIWLIFQKNVFEEGKTLENPSLMVSLDIKQISNS
jgi:hypothetical protein